VDARPLDQLEPAALTDAVLSGIWAEVARLRAARIAHRDLRLAGVLAFRLVTFWLPILPGWLVFRRLLRERLL